MLQVYSNNVDVNANAFFPLNNVVLDKGNCENLSGPATIQLNQRGVYLIEVDGFANPGAAGLVSVQLQVNGVLQPQAISSFTGTVGTVDTFNFKTFVQVSENNCNCCCYTSPTVLQFINGETAVTEAHINVAVTKIH